MKTRRPTYSFWIVQVIVLAAFAGSWFAAGTGAAALGPVAPSPRQEVVHIERDLPLRVSSLYDDPQLISDEELAGVLKQVQPRFSSPKLKPNFVEHALRIWGVDATFQDPKVLSGAQLRDFLIDHGKFLAAWGDKMDPLLIEEPGGVAIRWGKEECGSVHHDHWLACLTEAGIPLHEAIYTPSQHTKTINDALQQALRDFHVDERETEWSSMAFGLWLPPTKQWTTQDGRQMSFDLLGKRLLRGSKRFGVCHGTHRLYSMMLLIRLDDTYHILSPEVRDAGMARLREVRQLLIDSQFPDGHWPSNWELGAAAVENPVDEPLKNRVIATGHHLELLAIAPEELHPPRESIRKAARWAIDTTLAKTPAEIEQYYTFFSHVGGALALWRNTRPADFWRTWEQEHPFVATDAAASSDESPSAP
jgi:hypothetical protein